MDPMEEVDPDYVPWSSPMHWVPGSDVVPFDRATGWSVADRIRRLGASVHEASAAFAQWQSRDEAHTEFEAYVRTGRSEAAAADRSCGPCGGVHPDGRCPVRPGRTDGPRARGIRFEEVISLAVRDAGPTMRDMEAAYEVLRGYGPADAIRFEDMWALRVIEQAMQADPWSERGSRRAAGTAERCATEGWITPLGPDGQPDGRASMYVGPVSVRYEPEPDGHGDAVIRPFRADVRALPVSGTEGEARRFFERAMGDGQTDALHAIARPTDTPDS